MSVLDEIYCFREFNVNMLKLWHTLKMFIVFERFLLYSRRLHLFYEIYSKKVILCFFLYKFKELFSI